MEQKIAITKDTPIETVKKYGEECSRCNSCCKYDTGIVLEEDIPRIAKHLKLSEKQFKEKYLVEHEKFNTKCFKLKQEKNGKPYGKCIFLDEQKGCKIHTVKPLHCNVCSAKSTHGEALSHWFTLNYLVNTDDPESVRQWASFLKDHPTIMGGRLHELIKNKEKLKKILSFEILK